MKTKYNLLLRQLMQCLSVLLILSCTVENHQNNETPATTVAPTPDNENTDDKTMVTFCNNAQFDVNVYFGVSPYYGSSFVTVGAGKTDVKEVNPSDSPTGDTFYFEYLIPIGNVIFPYFSFKPDIGYKTMKIEHSASNQLVIDKVMECPTEDCYILIENKTTSDIYLSAKIGDVSSVKFPYGHTDRQIVPDRSGVYQISSDSKTLSYNQLSSLYIMKNAAEFSPLPEIDYQPGYIYTVSVTSAGAVLKAVTPFDIDIQEQIWSADVSDDTLLVSKIRPDNTGGGGFYAVGKKTYPQTSLDIIYVDKYGRVLSDKTIEITASSGQRLADADVMDYTVTKYGHICLLVQKTIEETFEYEYALMIIRMVNDGNIRLLKHIPLAEDDAGYWVFDTVVQNMLIEYEDNKFAFVGAVVDSSNNMCGFIATVDPDNDNPLTIRRSGNASDVASGVYSIFESVYYDGEDFVICGFENCDYKYEDRIHRGVVYKANRDLSHLECEYSKDKCLFFAVCGNGRDYYICGEYTDTGKSTKGCLLLSSGSGEPRFIPFPPMNYPNMLFEKIFVNKDKLYLCGTTANNIYGNDKNFATVVITDLSGRELSYTLYNEYDKAVSCVNNFIDTYLVQLHSVSPGRTRIISTDLLFKDSGVRRSILR